MRKLKAAAALLLALVLLCATGAVENPASAAKKITATYLDEHFSAWYYVPETVPENLRTNLNMSFIVRLQEEGKGSTDDITKASVKFVSGDDFLKDALSCEMMERQGLVLHIHPETFTQPGQAVFHFSLKSSKYSLEEDRTLTVYSWEDHPLLEMKEGEYSLYVQPGQPVPAEEVLNAAVISHVQEIQPYDAGFDMWCDQLDTRPVDFDWNNRTVTVGDYGEYPVLAHWQFGNIYVMSKVTLIADGYRITGKPCVGPGGQEQYRVDGFTAGKSFTWSVEGEGASMDPESGTLTVGASVPAGTRLTVTASPDDGDPVSMAVMVYEGMLADLEFTLAPQDGFLFPVVQNNGWSLSHFAENAWRNSAQDNSAAIVAGTMGLAKHGLVLNDEQALDEFPDPRDSGEDLRNIESRDIRVDGRPVRIMALSGYSRGSFFEHMGIIYYPRNSKLMVYYLHSIANGRSEQDTPRVTLDDMEYLAGMIRYDESAAPMTAADAAVTITEKNGLSAVAAGKKLTFSASFANTELISKKNKNNGVTWSVTGSPEASIAKNGVLSVGKKLTEPAELVVTAVSVRFGTSAEYHVTALPAVKAITAEPAEISLPVGGEETIRVKLEPENVPVAGLSWTVDKKDILELTDNGDGTAAVRGVKAGKASVTVTEPGGKKVKIKITVTSK